MRRLVLCGIPIALFVDTFATCTALAVPSQVPYSGQLAENGALVSGTRDITVQVFDAATGGTVLYTEAFTGVQVTNGVFHLMLNAPAAVWSGADRWMGVSVNGGPELVPRTMIGSVPYAVRAGSGPSGGLTATELAYGRTPAQPGTSCANIKATTPWAEDGVYLIDPDGDGPIATTRVLCDMTRDGGGWTLIIKNRYQSGMANRADGFGTVDDLAAHQSDFYKLPDATINAVIGDGTFDILADQAGYNSAYSSGNHEYVIVRNYTATFSFTGPVPESSTSTVFESYRAVDNLLVWRGRLGCGVGGAGINCTSVLTTPSPVGAANPAGGAGCLFALGTATASAWHHFYMSESNADTYLYICNGAQHSSGFDLSHRWWVR